MTELHIPYLQTGELARMFSLNKQTLFYYDKEGILQPEYRDAENGYRKYRFDQIYRLALICYLRKTGFSIEQIKNYLSDSTAESNILKLRQRSEALRQNYQELLRLDDIIQRKLAFVERELAERKNGQVQIKRYPPRKYLPLGIEQSIYEKEAFYCYPTIALYQYNHEEKRYLVTFGAYLESDADIERENIHTVKSIPEQKFLCFYWKGKYTGIEKKLHELRAEYQHLNLSENSYNFNIIDQFLEKDLDQYITKIQIPIIE